MREAATDLADFEALLASSIESAGPFIRESLEMPVKSMTAGQLLTYWNKFHTAAVAHTTAAGEPRVAPTGVGLFRGHFVVPTVAEAARARAVRKRPPMSISHFDEGDLAVIAHGHATAVGPGDAMFQEIASLHRELGGGRDVSDWTGTGVYLLMMPTTLYTFARYPEQFPG